MNPFKSNLKTLVLIDGMHLASMAKKHNMHVEFKELRSLMTGAPLLGSPRYYTALQVQPSQAIATGESRSGVQGLVDWLAFNGYYTYTENIYPIPSGFDSRDKWSPNNIVTYMMLDALSACFEPGYDRLLLIAGSRDFIPVIKNLRGKFVQVDILSSLDLDVVDTDLRRNCDNFYEFTKFAELFWRERNLPTTQ